MLTLNRLRKVYASVVAVDDVSFEVHENEIYGLLGPNGAGKTTTIRMILNIISPDSGEVLYDGKPFTPATRDGIGFLPEERGLYRKSTVTNCILYFGELRGIQRTEARRRAQYWLKRFEISQLADRKVEELSKGNQQKVQFITAILHEPRLVILDEPFSGLDPINQILLKDIFMDLRKAGKAIIFSTHMMEQAEKLCERITLINKGRVVLGGDLESVKSGYGKRTVNVAFSGDASFLRGFPGVTDALVYENSAELTLAPGAVPEQLLRALIDRISVTSFALQQPSLHTIFLDAVGGTNGAPKGAGGGSPV